MSSLTPAPLNFQERIRSAVAEQMQLSDDDILVQVVNLLVTLDVNTVTTTDSFQMPADRAFVGWEMHAHLAMNALSTELTLGTGASTSVLEYGGMRDRAVAKLMNCHYLVDNIDAMSAPLPIVDTTGQNSANTTAGLQDRLSTLWPDAGGQPMRWARGNRILPLIVRPRERHRFTGTLIEKTDTRLVAAAEYGVSIWGAFVAA